MATLTMAQTYAYARQAGFDPAEAVIISAIAAGESGLRTDALGDVDLQDSQWGPSVGLTQVRTLKADTGTGRTRDISILTDPLQNMLAAFTISNEGRDWTPWTVYNTGKYRQFLSQATDVADDYVPGTPISIPDPRDLLPDLPDLNALIDQFRTQAIIGLILAGGAALVVAGAWQTVSGRRR